MAALDWQEINRAAQIIRAGGLVAIPTETVYGLAADATDDRAVARIFEAKGRPAFNPLIVHVLGLEDAARHADMTPPARRLAEAFWPGPLTLVLRRRPSSDVSLLATAGLDTIALRAPSAPIARALIETAERPLAAPSANRSGAVSPTTADHVRDSLGDRVDMILDGGPCPVGVESTIISLYGEPTLLRPGGVAVADIEQAMGRGIERISAGPRTVEAPGMLVGHYAPAARLRLDVDAPRADEAYLAFGPAPAGHRYTFNLSQSRDLREAAANLFAHLRALDLLCAERGLQGIAAAPVPMEGLGEAINDRLRRAAGPLRQGP